MKRNGCTKRFVRVGSRLFDTVMLLMRVSVTLETGVFGWVMLPEEPGMFY